MGSTDYAIQRVEGHWPAANSLDFSGGMRFSMAGCISLLSDWSDCICSQLVTEAACQYSPLISTPKYFVEMLFWIEDKRFPIHLGVDPIAILRALYFDLRGGRLQGASTISQQIYNVRSGGARDSRSLGYKFRQSCWSVYLSLSKGKGAILKEYVDSVYWGRAYHGLNEAARGYFKASRDSLSVAESFFLVERLANPNRVSVQRIFNLLRRVPIRSAFRDNGTQIGDVISLYQRIFGSGGDPWQLPVK